MRYTLILISALLVTGTLGAQFVPAAGSNIDIQPLWGPTGHDHVAYYYLPDIDAYYDVHRREFYYFDGGRWVGASHLPSHYSGFDLYNSYKVVINEPKAYNNHGKHRTQYAAYLACYGQPMIRDSHDPRYYVVKGHPQHNKWVNRQGNGKGNGKGDDKDDKKDKKD